MTPTDPDIRRKPELIKAGQVQSREYPLADWPDPWNTGHHLETGADGIVRAVADTPEIAARDERYFQAAAEFFEETGVYVAPDSWDTENQHHEEAAEETRIVERASDREAGA
jgi:hypothetical protein